MTLAAGVRLGPYEIRELLGTGGMAEVYRAHDPRLGRDVAVKMVLTEGTPDPERLRRFEREARAVAALSHPNVLTVYDVGAAGGRPYLVLELLQGESLRHRLERGPVPLRQAVEIAVEVCRGLEAAHEQGLVHCDLKPENLFLTSDGRVKILDFGIARLTHGHAGDAARTDTSPHLLMGTMGYLAPEQARGQAPDGRADLFALGAILYEMLSGRRAFSGASQADTLAAILYEDPAPPRTAFGPLPAVVDRIVRRCLHKSPDERFHSAHDLAFALEAVLDRPLPWAGGFDETEERDPYPGLAAFTEADAGRFFGRDAEVTALWRRLRSRRLVAVIGPSGVGKTSLVRAGVAASQPTGWAVIVCTPGRSPLQSLGQALAPHLAGDPDALRDLVRFEEEERTFSLLARWRRGYVATVVVVDQFEELFTLNGPEAQARFARLLGRLAAEADIRVLLSMRDDFLIRCHEHEGLSTVFEGVVPLGPPAGEALRRALVEPARSEGFVFEEGLADEMLAAVEGERGALPLLAFAVSRLWAGRDRTTRTLGGAVYGAIGGVAGALAQHAEETLTRVGADREATVREIFRNLVTAEGTRASVDREELLSAFPDPGAAEQVLDELVDARLLTTYEVGSRDEARSYRVEIVHESLLKAWPRLVLWQAQDAEGAVLRDQLKQAARLWDARGRLGDVLWSGTSLREYELWRERYPGALTGVEEDFARAMLDQAERRTRLRYGAVAGVFAALLLVLVVIGALLGRTNRALESSVANEARARASRLVALGRLELDRYPTAAVAFARKSLETADTIEGRLLALEALWRGPTAHVLNLPAGADCTRVAFASEGASLACAGFLDKALVWNDDGGPPLVHAGLPLMADLRGVAFDEGSRRILTWAPGDPALRLLGRAEADVREIDALAEWVRVLAPGEVATLGPVAPPGRERVVRRWSLAEGSPADVGRWTPPPGLRFDQAGMRPVSLDPRLRWVAYGSEADVFLHPLGGSPSADRRIGRHPARLREVEFDPSGSLLLSLDGSGVFRVWSVPAGRLLRELKASPPHRYSQPVFSGDGARVAWTSGEGTTHVWDLRAPPDEPTLLLQRTDVHDAGDGAFDPRGRWLAAAGRNTVSLWSLRLPHAIVLRAHAEGPLLDLAFSRDSKFLASCARDGARLWPLDGSDGRMRRVEIGGDYSCYGLGFTPDARHLALNSPYMGTYLVPLKGGAARRILASNGRRVRPMPVAFDRAGTTVAVAPMYAADARDMVLQVLDLASGAERRIPLRPEGSGGGSAYGAYSLAFRDDGRLLMAGPGGLRLWDLASRTAERWSWDERSFAVAATDASGQTTVALLGELSANRLQLHDPRLLVLGPDGRVTRRIVTHGSSLGPTVALDAAGRFVVTGDASGAVRVGALSGEEPHLLLGHAGPVNRVAISPDGRWIASASGTEIRLWPMPDVSKPPFHKLPHGELMARLRALTNLRVVEDPPAPAGYRLDVGPFPGWKDVPTW
jgi:WD40 repeat protein